MSGSTAGGLPYATGTDLVRDGDNAIKALADALEARGHGWRTVAFHNVPAFDVNGLWYMGWSTITPVAWTQLPVVSAILKNTATGPGAGIHVQVYHPHNSTTTLVLQAAYVNDGRVFNGSIDVDVIAVGRIN